MLLTNDVGLRASDLHRLKSFWTTLKSREDVDALRAELTALRTSSDVTKRLREKNNGASIGPGAQRSQSSLNAFLQAVRQPAACALRGEPALVFCVLFFVRVKSSDDISGSETPHALRRVAVRRALYSVETILAHILRGALIFQRDHTPRGLTTRLVPKRRAFCRRQSRHTLHRRSALSTWACHPECPRLANRSRCGGSASTRAGAARTAQLARRRASGPTRRKRATSTCHTDASQRLCLSAW